MKSKVIYIFLILVVLFKGYFFSHKYDLDDVQKEYILHVDSIKEITDKKVSYYVKLNNNDKFILNIYSDKYQRENIELSKYTKFEYGDVIKVIGKMAKLAMLNNPGEFNYRLYLYSNNIHGIINTYSNPQKVDYSLNILEKCIKKIYSYKKLVDLNISNCMEENMSSIAKAVIYGDKMYLADETSRSFEKIGVSHLMSVSGAHVISFIYIIKLIFKNREESSIFRCICIICFVILYMFFTGFSISCIRASLMIIINSILKMLNKKSSRLKTVFISLIIILIYNPYAIFNTGLQLSVLAVIGIILFNSYITKGINYPFKNIKNKLLKKVLRGIISSISITICVQLLILPIQISVFNKIYIPCILPNLIIGIIATPIRIIGNIGVFTSFIPSISYIFLYVIKVLLEVLKYFVDIFNKFSITITTRSIPPIFFLLYYIFILTLYLLFKLKNAINNSNQKNANYNLNKLIKLIKIFNVVIIIVLILSNTALNIYSLYYSSYIYFFNVEQGDMSYIKCGKESVIVDIGSKKENLAFNTISNFFKKENLNKVDVIILSHMHTDHINGLEEFVEKYNVGLVIYSKPYEETEEYAVFKNILDKYNVAIKEVKSGDTINLKNITIDVLLPDDSYILDKDGTNINSLICKISVLNKDILYMADAYKSSEYKLIEKMKEKIQGIEIIKIGHHGSKTSTSSNLLNVTKPEYAVISACKKYYNHPHEATLEILKQNLIKVYLTEKQGAIKFRLN